MIEIDLEAWKKKHPRASKWYPDWYVDFVVKGALKKDVTEPYSWTWCMNAVGSRDGWKCRICGGKGEAKTVYGHTIEVHHIIPKSKGGADHPLNLITLCNLCHQKTFLNNYEGLPGVTFNPEITKCPNHTLDEFICQEGTPL